MNGGAGSMMEARLLSLADWLEFWPKRRSSDVNYGVVMAREELVVVVLLCGGLRCPLLGEMVAVAWSSWFGCWSVGRIMVVFVCEKVEMVLKGSWWWW